MVKHTVYINKHTGERIHGFQYADCENMNPVLYYRDAFFVKSATLLEDMSIVEINSGLVNLKDIGEKAHRMAEDYIKSFHTVKVPSSLLDLLNTTKKSKQVKLMKDTILTPSVILAFLIRAGLKGYTFSRYSFRIPLTGIDERQFPYMTYEDENKNLHIVGETSLSTSQLQHYTDIQKHNNLIFIQNEASWHCFFITKASVDGKETWLGKKQPHYHYISNAFGHSKEHVIEELKSGKYNLGNLPHIKLEDFGNQPV